MNPRLSRTNIPVVLMVVCGLVMPSRAQQPNFLVPVELNGQTLRGSAGTAKMGNEGMIGIDGKLTDAGYKVEVVRPNFPAAIAGIQQGDIIVSLDGIALEGTAQDALKPVASKGDGETLRVGINRNGESRTVVVKVGLRKNLLANDTQWIAESKMPPAVTQFLFDGSAAAVAELADVEQYPNHVFLFVSFFSKDAPPFSVDDNKFFILDGTGQQLRHLSLDEIKYGIQLAVAQNWKGGNYPPPPAPVSRQYTISGVENGNYTITNLGGGIGTLSSTSQSTYTVSQQPDFTQLGYSLGLAIRMRRDNKSNEKLLEQANAAIASWEAPYFKSQSPIVGGENRGGEIMYWTGSSRRPQPPYRVVLFITDPRTQREEHVTFLFGSGAEKLKEELSIQNVNSPAKRKADKVLTDEDVIGMLKAGLGAEIVVAKIKSAACAFDTSPAALKQLKDAGVPDSVILAMVQAPRS